MDNKKKSMRLKLLEESSNDEVREKVAETMIVIDEGLKKIQRKKTLHLILESSKLAIGFLLTLLTLINAFIYSLLSLKILNFSDFIFFYRTWSYGGGGGASNAPIFFGLCSIAGAYLMINTKLKEK